MFGRKPKKATMFSLMDANENEIMRGNVQELKLTEEAVIRMSERYFNDPDPCFIHREAVRKRAVMEIMGRIGETEVSEFSEELQLFFKEGRTVRVWEDEK